MNETTNWSTCLTSGHQYVKFQNDDDFLRILASVCFAGDFVANYFLDLDYGEGLQLAIGDKMIELCRKHAVGIAKLAI